MIHQPLFLPWVPYILRVALSEVFVVLDDLLYRKKYYQNRTKFIDTRGNPIWITLPTVRGQHPPINQVKLGRNCDWFMKKTIRTLTYSYASSPYFAAAWSQVREFLLDVCSNENYHLSDVSLDSIKLIFSLLDIKLPTIRLSSDLGVRNFGRTERIVEICRLTHRNTVLTGWGGGLDPKVHNLQLLADEGIEMRPLSREALVNVEPEFGNVGISTLHWIFVKGPSYVREKLLEYDHSQMES
jgi:hypothetical protein